MVRKRMKISSSQEETHHRSVPSLVGIPSATLTTNNIIVEASISSLRQDTTAAAPIKITRWLATPTILEGTMAELKQLLQLKTVVQMEVRRTPATLQATKLEVCKTRQGQLGTEHHQSKAALCSLLI